MMTELFNIQQTEVVKTVVYQFYDK